jgi:hypothetical protein
MEDKSTPLGVLWEGQVCLPHRLLTGLVTHPSCLRPVRVAGLLDEAVAKWFEKVNPPEDSMSRRLAFSMQRQVGHDLLQRNIITPIYLTGFCEEDNVLSQWRAYGQSGRYSIGFRMPSEGIVCGLRPEPPVYTAPCVKVEYDRSEQLRRVP